MMKSKSTPSQPCKKDPNICQLYEDIRRKYISCIPKEDPDLKKEHDCVQDILDMIYVSSTYEKAENKIRTDISNLQGFANSRSDFNVVRPAIQHILGVVYNYSKPLHERILEKTNACFPDEREELSEDRACTLAILNLIIDFDRKHPSYGIRERLTEETVEASKHLRGEEGVGVARKAIQKILTVLRETGQCDCEEDPQPCKKDPNICQLYEDIYQKRAPISSKRASNSKATRACAEEIVEMVRAFDTTHKTSLRRSPLRKEYAELSKFSRDRGEPISTARNAVERMLVALYDLGQCDCEEVFKLSENAAIQSPHLYLQSAGSKGHDSTKGIHLRWMLKGGLSDHLPKGNYATTTANFNKAEDYVRVLRTPYLTTNSGFNTSTPPQQVNHQTQQWQYKVNNHLFELHFSDTQGYLEALARQDPMNKPAEFLKDYGDRLLEITLQTALSFSVTVTLDTGEENTTYLELLSVEEGERITADRFVSLRQKRTTSFTSGKKYYSENIRSVRLKGGSLRYVRFELYSDFLAAATEKGSFVEIGKYALSKDTAVVNARLEPRTGAVNGKWLRYKDSAYVNTDNYKERWNGATLSPEDTLLETVNDYIRLSDDPSNPRAVTQFAVGDQDSAPFQLSQLAVLQLAALDYHTARMLGLGVLDVDEQTFSGQFIYLAEYHTTADLGDGKGQRQVQHLYCSLPTGLDDQRLPLPVDLQPVVPGIAKGQQTTEQAVITDEEGYAFDGKTRFLSLFHQVLPQEKPNAPFYATNYTFSSAERTLPVYAGIAYRRRGTANWAKPELVFDARYFNKDSTVVASKRQETRPIVIPQTNAPLFVHREKQSGTHEYSAYGINWFGRASASQVIRSVTTRITPANLLLPPTNANAVFIRREQPLLLTSATEQAELQALTTPDKTFIRLTFDYHHAQELISYHKTIDGEQMKGYSETEDKDELFADEVEIFFRNHPPRSISGEVNSVRENLDSFLVDITAGKYTVESSGTPPDVVTPSIAGDGRNFVGSVITFDRDSYLVHRVDNSGSYPKMTIVKNDTQGRPAVESDGQNAADWVSPPLGGLFLMVENMQTAANWRLPDDSAPSQSRTPQPIGFRATIDHTTVHREEIAIATEDGTVETHLQKFRGIYEVATVRKQLEDHDAKQSTASVHRGRYTITFEDYALPQHSQGDGPKHRVEWHNGIVRLHTQNNPKGERKVLKVIRTQHIGTSNKLVLHVLDPTFSTDSGYDSVRIGKQRVNYYPGYKVYLFHAPEHHLDEQHLLPAPGETERYCVFGLRVHDRKLKYRSKISPPTLMFVQQITSPKRPQLPRGSQYASRPDFFGKATYTFKTAFQHRPYALQFGRASDIQILSAVYASETVAQVMKDLLEQRQSARLNDRWHNFLNGGEGDGKFQRLPASGSSGVRMPLPNNPDFIAGINAFIKNHNAHFGQSVALLEEIRSMQQVVIPQGDGHDKLRIVDFFEEVVFNCFVPLTELPIIYAYIKGKNYQPVPKKQTVRDGDGALLPPQDEAFDMAPMMKVTATGSPHHEVQFTDFSLDGASNAHYFYAVREMNLQMKTSSYSPVLGPVKLVHTAHPKAPEIVKVTPSLEDAQRSIKPAIHIELNRYAETQHIKKISLYRANQPADALAVRTMKMVREQPVEELDSEQSTTWTVTDEFSDLGYVPYGDPLFYRIVAQREVTYHDRDGNELTEYAPSSASELVVTNIVENSSPDAPLLTYYATAPEAGKIKRVTLAWNKTVHNGTYTLHKMNAAGNWTQIYQGQSNAPVVHLPLADTQWKSDTLTVEHIDGKQVFHHFKVVAQNFAGMTSREERLLTIYQPETWQDINDK